MPTRCLPPRVSRFGSVLPSIKVSPGLSSCPSRKMDGTTCARHPWYATAQLSKMLRSCALLACAVSQPRKQGHRREGVLETRNQGR